MDERDVALTAPQLHRREADDLVGNEIWAGIDQGFEPTGHREPRPLGQQERDSQLDLIDAEPGEFVRRIEFQSCKHRQRKGMTSMVPPQTEHFCRRRQVIAVDRASQSLDCRFDERVVAQ